MACFKQWPCFRLAEPPSCSTHSSERYNDPGEPVSEDVANEMVMNVLFYTEDQTLSPRKILEKAGSQAQYHKSLLQNHADTEDCQQKEKED